MGKLTERRMITSVAQLILWRRVPGAGVYITATIIDSHSTEFANGRRTTWKFQSETHYPALTGHWKEHYLFQWWDNTYVKADLEDMERIIEEQFPRGRFI